MAAPPRLYVDRISAENAVVVFAAFVDKERLGLPDKNVATDVHADLLSAATDELRRLMDCVSQEDRASIERVLTTWEKRR